MLLAPLTIFWSNSHYPNKQIEPTLLSGSHAWRIPTSNRAVRLKLGQINTKQLTSEIKKALSALNARIQK